MRRCAWATTELGIRYHDEEWGSPVHDDRRLFEFLILEGAQAGLSWETILKKREAYRAAFDGFDPAVVARYDEAKKHPDLVPYDELSDSEKHYDRDTAMETLKAIIALGYRIEPPSA